MSPASRWYRNKYGLTDAEGVAFAMLRDPQAADRELDEFGAARSGSRIASRRSFRGNLDTIREGEVPSR